MKNIMIILITMTCAQKLAVYEKYFDKENVLALERNVKAMNFNYRDDDSRKWSYVDDFQAILDMVKEEKR